MPRVRDLLHRFRPAGAPGVASSTGVPADRGADLAAELEPLFALLVATERECADILGSAHQEAGESRARDAEQARRTVAAARERLDAERAAATAQALRRREPDAGDALAAPEREVVELRRRASERMPTYVDRVVASVRALIGEEPRVDQTPAGVP